MSGFRKIAVLSLVVFLAFGPAVAEASAGAGYNSGSGSSSYSSMGSRGSRTFDALPGAAPIQRSITPSGPSAYRSAGSAWISPGYGYGYGHGGFMHGLAGGLFGAWIGSMLFGGPSYAYGGGAMHAGGFLGTFLMFLAVFFIGRMIWRGVLGGGFYIPRVVAASGMGGGYQPVPRTAQYPVPLGQSDFDMFGQILTQVQGAWNHGDIDRLRRYCTPEMLAYFGELLANNASQGVANRIENVTLLQGKPREAWQEGEVQYASVYLRWTALDYTHRTDRGPGAPGWLVDGSTARPIEEQEIWTFRRSTGGRWLLSAIQQLG